MKNQLSRLFAVIDRMDSDSFALFLTENASFRFGNQPPVLGRENIRLAVSNFFSTIKGLHHRISNVWEFNNTVICEGQVTYRRSDAKEITVPFVDILEAEGELIADYRIYIDISPLF